MIIVLLLLIAAVLVVAILRAHGFGDVAKAVKEDLAASVAQRTKSGLTYAEAKDAVLYRMGGCFHVPEYAPTHELKYNIEMCAEHREWMKTVHDDPVLMRAYDYWLSHWENGAEKELAMRKSGERQRLNEAWEKKKQEMNDHGARSFSNARKIDGPR